MGYPGKNHKRYERPTRKFEKERIQEEAAIIVEYGLRNKRELWRTQSLLRNHRRAAMERGLHGECLEGFGSPEYAHQTLLKEAPFHAI